MAGKKEAVTEIDVLKILQKELVLHILGATPIILNRMSEKARRELLFPKGRKSAAEKASSLKHDPYQEFLASPYKDPNPNGPTLIQHLSSSFKKAMAAAALDIPGSSKAQMGRLAWVKGDRVSIYGVPQLKMDVVRSADMNRTPDIRTRACIPQWACQITVAFATPMLKQTAVANLMAAAGFTQGVGDWRPEKGAGTYGAFEVVQPDDPRWHMIVNNGGRQVQEAAMKNPDFYDEETAELYSWFNTEVKTRGFDEIRKHKPSNGVAPVIPDDDDAEGDEAEAS